MTLTKNVAIGKSEDNKHEITNTSQKLQFFFHLICCCCLLFFALFRYSHTHTHILYSIKSFCLHIFSPFDFILVIPLYSFTHFLRLYMYIFHTHTHKDCNWCRQALVVGVRFPWKSVIFDRRYYANTEKVLQLPFSHSFTVKISRSVDLFAILFHFCSSTSR